MPNGKLYTEGEPEAENMREIQLVCELGNACQQHGRNCSPPLQALFPNPLKDSRKQQSGEDQADGERDHVRWVADAGRNHGDKQILSQ